MVETMVRYEVKTVDDSVINLETFLKERMPSLGLGKSTAYIVWMENNTIYVRDGDGNIVSLSNQNQLQALINSAQGLIYFKPGDYGGITVTLTANVRAIIEKGVTNLTVNPPTTGYTVIENYNTGTITSYKDGTQLLQFNLATGDIDLGANKILFSNVALFEKYTNQLAVRDKNDTTDYALRVGILYPVSGIQAASSALSIKTTTSATAYIALASHSGSAYVTNLKLIGGYVEIYNGKLMSSLNSNGYGIVRTGWISGGTSSGLRLYEHEDKTSGGVGIHFYSADSTLSVWLERLQITGGVDVADIKIINAYLDFNDQTLQSTAGALAGYIVIKVGGVQYKVPVYNMA